MADDSIMEEPSDEDNSIKDAACIVEETGKDDLDEEHKAIEGDDKTPQVGMVFKSYAEVSDFYKQYAHRLGFGVSVRRSTFTKAGQCYMVDLECSRAGKGRAEPSYQSRPTAKTNCQAMIRLKLMGDGLLHLLEANLEHNHVVDPSMTKFLRCSKKLSSAARKHHEDKGKVVIQPDKKRQTLAVQAARDENLPCGGKEFRNSFEKVRLKLGHGDAEAIYHYFTHMQTKNSNFFYSVDLDEEGHLRNIFWADSSSRTAYKYFGDVISFDTTYLNDKYGLPVASFVGVNHHGQSVLLGCSLLQNETTETYIWVYKTWLSCMSGCPPNAIITNHCKAIQDAVAEVFPGARHRLCLWHIMEMIPEKLRGLAEYKAVKKALKKAVYDSSRVEEFEEQWNRMTEGYGLEGNEWINSLYENRHSWAPVFLKDTFWAGMSTTQRDESINAFFEECIHPETSLKQFLSRYEASLQSKYEKEAQADFESFHKSRNLVSKFYMEEQLSELYTINMFKKFQDELKATIYCYVSLVKVDGPISTFEIKESVFLVDGKRTENKDHEVLFSADELEVKCICGSFQFRGILCRHVLSVFKLQQVYEIPSQYIVDRWRRDFKRLYALSHSIDDVIANNRMERYDYLSMRCLQLVEVGVIFDDKYQLALKLISEVEKFLLNDSTCGVTQVKIVPCETTTNENDENRFVSKLGVSEGNMNPIPSQLKRRGRPPKKGKESNMETIVRSSSNNKKDSVRTPLLGNHCDLLPVAPTASHFGAEVEIQESINLMEEVNPNELSLGSHVRLQANHHHPSGYQSGVQSLQFDPQTIRNQLRMQWIYQHMIQEAEIPKAPHG